MLRIKEGFQGERSIVLPQAIISIMEEDPLVKNLFVTDIGYYPSAAHHYRSRINPIDQHVMIIVSNGSGWYESGGKRREVKRGEYFVLPSGVPHAYGSSDDDPWTIFCLHIRGELSAYYTEHAYDPIPINVNHSSRIANRMNVFDEILTTLENGYSIENLRYMSGLLTYFLSITRYMVQYRNYSSEGAVGGNTIEETIHFMKEQLGRRLTLQQMADYAGYSTSHFSSIFKRTTGLSPITYFNHLKIQMACQLLTTTKMTVTQVSLRLGIADPYYFSRLFSEVMGMSPSEYRSLSVSV